MSGQLWLLPVSLGNPQWKHWLPEEVQKAACRIQYFVVENAKTARAELKQMEHPVPMRELHIEQMPEPLQAADIDRLLAPAQAGHDIAILSEAGCPAVADPGALLVRRAHQLGMPVNPLVGPSSILLTLMASGLDGQRFAFHGYLPARDPERSGAIKDLERESAQRRQTQLFIETPYRNEALFAALLQQCKPTTRLCVAIDLTLESQSIRTLEISQWRKQAATDQLARHPAVFALLA
jgi:16S rRNA (cytidine1402-2'-O)-methyltransferase